MQFSLLAAIYIVSNKPKYLSIYLSIYLPREPQTLNPAMKLEGFSLKLKIYTRILKILDSS